MARCDHTFASSPNLTRWLRCLKCGMPNPLIVADLVDQVVSQHMQDCPAQADCTIVKTLRSAATDLRLLPLAVARYKAGK